MDNKTRNNQSINQAVIEIEQRIDGSEENKTRNKPWKKSKWRVIGEVGKVFDKDNDEIWNFFGEKE